MMPVRRQSGDSSARDEGFTLIEVLVAMGLFAVIGSLLLSLALSTNDVTQQTRNRTAVAEEARTAMERMTRELRQSSGIDTVTLPSTPGGGPTSFTFWTDFDGDGVRDTDAADPEVLTYCWDPTSQQLTLSAVTGCSGARPVLAATVTSFVLELRSSEWQYDTTGGTACPSPPAPCGDGITTWEELDHAGPPVGDNNGQADNPELAHVDLVAVSITVRDGHGTQTYRTQIDLRNRS